MSGCLISDGRLFQTPEPMCCHSKCSVAKRALCATDDQCSSVGRTQSSDTGVGDESAVVSQVARDVTGQRPMNQWLCNGGIRSPSAALSPPNKRRCGHVAFTAVSSVYWLCAGGLNKKIASCGARHNKHCPLLRMIVTC